jgi:hypothetical protein
MAKLTYWMIFQIMVGIWLFISPYILGEGMTSMTKNNMIFGAVVILVGLGMAFFSGKVCAAIQHPEKKSA